MTTLTNTITQLDNGNDNDNTELQKLLAESLKLPKKPRKKSAPKPEPEEPEEANQPTSEMDAAHIERQRIEAETWKGYDYNCMLHRVEDQLQKRGINTFTRGEKFSLSTATLAITLKSKKTTFENFNSWVASVYKSKNTTFDTRCEHVANYILSECCCTGVLSNGKLILRGRFQNNKIELILRKYIVAYHQCTCNSTKTRLHKCSTMRKFYNECENCGSKTYLEDYKMVNRVLIASKEK
jgi:translation initiation factor 2 beta subunit (eIF-2beta)/eIF-5